MSTRSNIGELLVGEHIQTIRRRHKIKRSEYLVTGRIPVVDQSQEFIAGYINDEERVYEGPLPVIVFGDHTCTLKYVDFPFAIGADGTQLIRPTSDFDIRYFYYSLRSLSLEHFGYQRQFKYLKEKKVLWRPMEDQRKIAAILSAYDDLIENNTQRIAILQEMARLLYREWFVHFRFPGHEKVTMVNSPFGPIAEGWEVKQLRQVCHLVVGQSPKSEFYNEEGNGLPFHQGVTDFGNLYPATRRYCTVTKRVAEEGDILFSVRAPVGRINVADRKMVIGRGLHAIRSKTGNQTFILLQLKDNFRQEDTMGSGTIFKAVTKSDMLGIQLLMPPTDLIAGFEQIVVPMFSLLKVLAEKNVTLRHTRDLLLPHLISGELDVSDLPIDTGGLTDDSSSSQPVCR